ncbi:hypothetical protein FRC04_007375 [Tulasnella sp. 424]|nr:hypothetical protein FRC04_007375 [Tulasnella sp. 424]
MDCEPTGETLQLILDEFEHLSINPSRITILKDSELGIGGYGEVCLATLDGSSQVAVKQLRIVQAKGTRIRLAVRLAREIRIWARVKHPNVLELVGYHLSENYVYAQLISPYMANGNVKEYMKRAQADVGVRLRFLEGITSGMAYLHSCSPPICHGDLKPDNVLVNDELNAVLCDFGLATFIEESEAASGLTTSRSIKGSTRYMSPELFLDIQAKHTLESDVWGWGCTIFEIITDCIPYSSVPGNTHVMLALVKGEPPGLVELLPKVDMPFRPIFDTLHDLILDSWNKEPTQRPLSRHILQQLHHAGRPQANPNANTNGNEEPPHHYGFALGPTFDDDFGPIDRHARGYGGTPDDYRANVPAGNANINGGEEPGDNDGRRTYCYCDRVSYGEMIGCDDDQCQRQWGEWVCDECKARRENEGVGAVRIL